MGQVLKGPKISPRDKSILELKIQRDKLKQYEKKLQSIMDKEIDIAKEQLLKKNHHAARLALSKKKYQEQLLLKTGQQLLTLENLVNTIEFKLVEQDVLKGIQQGNLVLNALNKEMDLENVEKLMDDTADAIAYQNEIQDIISKEFTEEDEADIIAQLDELVEMETQSKLLELTRVEQLPKIPDIETEKPRKQKIEQKKLENPLAS